MPASQPCRALELFAGYGGLALAAEPLGARTIAVAEIEPAPVSILAERFPGIPNLGDVKTADWSDVGAVDLISGGSPCQDISAAGLRREGMITGNRSGLWVSMRDAIADRRPTWVIWENVRAAVTSRASSLTDPTGKGGALRALGRVLGDLSSLGYDADWRLVKASDIGACHERARIFLLAWDRETVPAREPIAVPFADWSASGDMFEVMRGVPYVNKMPASGAMRDGAIFGLENPPPKYPALPYLRTPTATIASGGPLSAKRAAELGSEYRLTGQILDIMHPGWLDDNPDVKPGMLPTLRANDMNGHCKHGTGGPDLPTVVYGAAEMGHWGKYGPAVQRWADILGRAAPAATETSLAFRPRLTARFAEWIMGLPEGWVTDIPGNSRAAQLKALGNGVVPAQAEYALTTILEDIGLAGLSAPALAA